MKVVVDPNEMSAVARTLEQCAIEVADIGSHLLACVSCAMPPAVAGEVNALVAKADVILDQVGAEFVVEATGLVGRAIIAVLDSLAAASAVTAPSGPGVVGGGVALGMTITNGSPAGLYAMGGVVGGNAPTVMTITSDGSDTAGLYGMGGFVGGNAPLAMTFTNSDGSPAARPPELGSIGRSWSPDQGTDYHSPPSVVSISNSIGGSNVVPRSMSAETFVNNLGMRPTLLNTMSISNLNVENARRAQLGFLPPKPYEDR